MSENAVASALKAKPKVTKVRADGDVAKPKQTYFQMIVGAIRDLQEPYGSTRQAILKYIIDKHKLDAKVAALRCRLEIKKAMASGKLKHGKSEFSFSRFKSKL